MTVVIVLFRTGSVDLSWVPDGARVVLVHNDETPCTVTPDREVDHLHPGSNLGFGAAVNLAAGDLGGGRLILANPDTDLLPEHGAALATGGDDEIVAVPLVDPRGIPTSIVNLYPTPVGHLATGLRLGRHLPRGSRTRAVLSRAAGGYAAANARSLNVEAGTWPLATHWVSGGVVSFPAARFAEVGGFARDLFLYFEDVDLCARMGTRFPAMRIVVPEIAPGVHEVGGSGKVAPLVTARHHAASAVTYARRQSGPGWQSVTTALAFRQQRLERRVPRDDPQTAPVAAIVSLGRERSMGERRRVASWAAIATAAGLTPVEVSLLRDHRAGARPGRWPSWWPVLTGRAVLESLAWSRRSARRQLADMQPELVVLVTARAYGPGLGHVAPVTILDLVDRLDRSYRGRASEASDLRGRLAWSAVARSAERFHRRLGREPGVTTVLAGYREAEELGVDWVPILLEPAIPVTARPDHDVLFFGNLSYPPNIAAVCALQQMWPDVLKRRPGTTALVAGAHPTPQVRSLVETMGWTLVPHFTDVAELCARGRIAVVPLEHASGMQIKVLEAAALGVAQVVTPAVAAAFPPEAPFDAVPLGREFVDEVVRLLDDPARAASSGRAAADYLRRTFSAESWAGWLAAKLPDGSKATGHDSVRR